MTYEIYGYQDKFGLMTFEDAAFQTNQLDPRHTYLPWIIVDGQHNVAHEIEIIADIVKWACKSNNGTTIDGCKDY